MNFREETPLLERTFVMLPGIGEFKERQYWNLGIRTWRDFLGKGGRLLSPSIHRRYAPYLEECLAQRDNPSYFAGLLRKKGLWRLYGAFRERCFLDIETYSMGEFQEEVTVVGTYDGSCYRPFIQGRNLEKFQDVMKRFDLLITFNGMSFDVPVLERCFPGFRVEAAHIDLMHACRKAGLKGGLKRVEKHLGMERPSSVREMNGFDAVRLWAAYLDGETRALELLVRYNREDTVNLQPIMDLVYGRLCASLYPPWGPQDE